MHNIDTSARYLSPGLASERSPVMTHSDHSSITLSEADSSYHDEDEPFLSRSPRLQEKSGHLSEGGRLSHPAFRHLERILAGCTRKLKETPRRTLTIFASVVVLVFLLNAVVTSSSTNHVYVSAMGRRCRPDQYECLIQQAQVKFQRVMNTQSKTVGEARAEYRRRYKRTPPAGFDKWAQFALDHGAVMIDEYGQLEADLQPLREAKLSRKRVLERLNSTLETSKVAASRMKEPYYRLPGMLSIRKGVLQTSGSTMHNINNETLSNMLAPVIKDLPNLDILFNWNARPRVLSSGESEHKKKDVVQIYDASKTENEERLRKDCKSQGSHLTASKLAEQRPTIDLCEDSQGTEDIISHHGFVSSPASFFPTDTLVPILSRGKMSTMRDILIPNPCYAHNDYRDFDQDDNMPFKDKKKSIYWRGTTTGQYMRRNNYLRGQRSYFVALLRVFRDISTNYLRDKDTPLKQLTAAPPKTDAEQSSSPDLFSPLRKLDEETISIIREMPPDTFDAAYTYLYKSDIDPRFIDDFNKTFGISERVGHMDMFQHQLVADIDGESMSCRFYRQLDSNSVPLKQTSFAEWHDDRIVPWLHYIPISLHLKELPDLMQWLLYTDEGQESAEFVAKQGRAWAQRALRKVDLTIYYYRVLLEYASIVGQ